MPRLRLPYAIIAAAIGASMFAGSRIHAYVPTFSNNGRWATNSIVVNLELGSSNGPLSDGCADWGQCAENALALWNPARYGFQSASAFSAH